MILSQLLSTKNKATPNQPSSQYRSGYSIPQVVAGTYVNEDTALTYAAFWLCVKIISEQISALPLSVYNRKNATDKELAINSPIQTLLNYPNSEMTGLKWRQTSLVHRLVYGNSYSEILRDRRNVPGELQLITPDRVNKDRVKSTNAIVYDVSNGGGANTVIENDDMFHYYGMGFDGLTGYSVVQMARRTIAVGMAMEKFSSSFYENGTMLSGIIKVPKGTKLDDSGRKELKKSFQGFHKGVNKFFDMEVLDGGMEFEQLGMPLKDAQYIEDQKFKVLDVARWFNMPPHKLKDLDRATFSNIEEQNIDFVNDTLLPSIIDFEMTANHRLIGRNNTRQYVKHNLNALLRGNTATRGDYYTKLFNLGWSMNELRALEDQNSVGPAGDKRFVQKNMVTLENAGEQPEPQPPAPQEREPQPEQQTTVENFTALINHSLTDMFEAINEAMKRHPKRDNQEWKNNKITDCFNHVAGYLSLSADTFINQRNTNVSNFIHSAISSTINHYTNNEGQTVSLLVNSLTETFVDMCQRIKLDKVQA